jgi:hypothetical protein
LCGVLARINYLAAQGRGITFKHLFAASSPSNVPANFLQAAEKEVRGEVSGILREGKAASNELAAAEAAAEKAVSGDNNSVTRA